MSHLHCHFCSRPNAADAMFCEACGGQLSLRPCPNCDAVNDASAEVCYACKREFAQDAVDHPSAGNEHVALNAVLDDQRRRDYARIGLAGHDAVAVTNAVVTFEAARPLRARSATPFKGSILAAAAICVIVAIGVVFFVSTRGPVRSTAPVNGASPAQSAAPANPGPVERTSSAEAESAAASGPRQLRTSEDSASANSSVEAKRAEASQEKRVEAKKAPEPGAGRGRLKTGRAVGAAGMTGETAASVAACDPGVVALGLCGSQGTEATPAAGSKAPSDTARRSTKGEPRQQCTEAAAALGLCRQ